jgi:hypothetical protein
MGMKGMDVELVSEFGNRMRTDASDRIRELRTNVLRLANGLNWEGPDAQQFIGNDVPALTAALDRLVEALGEFGQCAIDNANAQAEISARL